MSQNPPACALHPDLQVQSPWPCEPHRFVPSRLADLLSERCSETKCILTAPPTQHSFIPTPCASHSFSLSHTHCLSDSFIIPPLTCCLSYSFLSHTLSLPHSLLLSLTHSLSHSWVSLSAVVFLHSLSFSLVLSLSHTISHYVSLSHTLSFYLTCYLSRLSLISTRSLTLSLVIFLSHLLPLSLSFLLTSLSSDPPLTLFSPPALTLFSLACIVTSHSLTASLINRNLSHPCIHPASYSFSLSL